MQTHLQAEGEPAGNFTRCYEYDSHTCHQTTPSTYIQNFLELPLISTQTQCSSWFIIYPSLQKLN